MTASTFSPADLILTKGKIATLDAQNNRVEAAAIKDGKFVAVGKNHEILAHRGPMTRVVDLTGRTAIPGLNDSHLHVIRGGLNYNMELRWDGVPSLADGLRMLKEQAQRTPPGQWIRVVGGWSEFQFAERRMPTLDEINAVSPDTPVFILHLYCSTRPRCVSAGTPRTRQTRSVAKFSETKTESRPGC
jgi:predicted amidohydrolase YtcJ